MHSIFSKGFTPLVVASPRSLLGTRALWARARPLTGFTLIEILLYVGIVSFMVFGLSTFFVMTIQSRVKHHVISEVEQQGAQVMQLILQTVRNASGINAPLLGATASSASLDVVNAAKDPTVFSLSGTVLRQQEGGGAPISLTSLRIVASGLTFENLSRPGTRGTLRVQFMLSYENPGGTYEYGYQKTFYGSATIR